MAELDFRLLGALEVHANGRPVRLAGRRLRSLVTALLVRANRPVPREVLLEAIWGGDAPASAPHALEVHVSRVRQALAESGTADRLSTAAAAYVLEVRPGELDLERFERLVERARNVLTAGDARAAWRASSEAVALWRDDDVLPELEDDPLGRIEAERLRELRTDAFELRTEALLLEGRHETAVAELQRLTTAYPLRERFRAQLMLALYRSGRQAEALEVYQLARRTLRDELGLEPSDELRLLEQAVLRQDTALAQAAIAAPAAPSRLPTPLGRLIGRTRDVAEIVARLEHDRLITLVGPGGVGKTRLALAAAAEHERRTRSPAWWVPLQAYTDAAAVLPAIAQALDAPVTDPAKALANAEGLLVLDNFEHLVDAAAGVAELLERSPRVRAVVTSREPLRIRGEVRRVVDPLSPNSAAELFLERARAIAPRFLQTPAVVAICERLDRLPLALELAAARAAVLDADELLAQLDRGHPALGEGARDSPARHLTLRAAVEWSVDALDERERTLFHRVAVFVGGFDLPAAEAVCGAALDAVQTLAEKSLLQRRDRHFHVLETIREYALELLDASGEAAELRERHAQHYLAVAESTNLATDRLARGQRHDVANAEQDNIRAALAWAVATGAVDIGLRTATAMENFWVTHDPREGMRWFSELLTLPDDVEPETCARALRAYGGASDIAGDDEEARRLYERSLAAYEFLGDEQGRATLLHRLSISAMRRGELERARELVEESLAIHASTQDRWGETQAVGTAGAIARDAGEHRRAAELIERSAAMAAELNIRWWESGMLAELASLALHRCDVELAEAQARAALKLATEVRDRAGRIFGVGLLARVAAERGDAARAGLLWGAVETEDAVAPLGGWRRHRNAHEAPILSVACPEFERARTEGLELGLDEAVTCALATRARSA